MKYLDDYTIKRPWDKVYDKIHRDIKNKEKIYRDMTKEIYNIDTDNNHKEKEQGKIGFAM